MPNKINWDALGITASVLCAIHCAVLPLAVASLPVLGVNIIHNPGFEYTMIGLAFIIGAQALWHGYRRHHRQLGPLTLFLLGMLFLVAKQVWHQHEFAFLPGAVILIISAHVLNYRSGRAGHPIRIDAGFPPVVGQAAGQTAPPESRERA